MITIKRTFQVIKMVMLVAGMMSTSGCVAMMVKAQYTEGTYAEMKPTMPSVPSGHGRLFIYLVDGGGFGDAVFSHCTIDSNLYQVYGGAFWWQDLPVGTHKVTAGDGFVGLKGADRYGDNSVEFHLKDGETKYCRLDMLGRGKNPMLRTQPSPLFPRAGNLDLTPTMVEASVAAVEISDLDFFVKNKPVGKVLKE